MHDAPPGQPPTALAGTVRGRRSPEWRAIRRRSDVRERQSSERRALPPGSGEHTGSAALRRAFWRGSSDTGRAPNPERVADLLRGLKHDGRSVRGSRRAPQENFAAGNNDAGTNTVCIDMTSSARPTVGIATMSGGPYGGVNYVFSPTCIRIRELFAPNLFAPYHRENRANGCRRCQPASVDALQRHQPSDVRPLPRCGRFQLLLHHQWVYRDGSRQPITQPAR